MSRELVLDTEIRGLSLALDFGEQSARATPVSEIPSYGLRPRPLPPRLTGVEIAAHRAFVTGQIAGALWDFRGEFEYSGSLAAGV